MNINTTLKFIGVGICDIKQANVCVYDECNNLIYEGMTYNGLVSLPLCNGCIYKVKACTKCESLFGAFIQRPDMCIYCFPFKSSFVEEPIEDNPITFLLTDASYDNLPIERGELIL